MGNLKEYSFKEWLTLQPFKWSLKQLRNDIHCSLYVKRHSPTAKDQLADVDKVLSETKNLLVTIAFEKPEVIELQVKALQMNPTEAVHLVADNSFSTTAQQAIAEICSKYACLYLKLPEIHITHNARSHSFALQWVYENLVRPYKLKKFGFIDHDLIPFKVGNEFKKLESVLAFGLKRDGVLSNSAWQLWTGYCFFNQKMLKSTRLNFMYDFANGLDSGGRNYHQLFKKHPGEEFVFSKQSVASVDTKWGRIEMELLNDGWLHLGGVAYMENSENRMQAFKYACDLLSKAVNEYRSFDSVLISNQELPIGITYMGYKDQVF